MANLFNTQKTPLDQDEEDFDSLASDLERRRLYQKTTMRMTLGNSSPTRINGPNIQHAGIREPEIYERS